jgi:hypothetical protein
VIVDMVYLLCIQGIFNIVCKISGETTTTTTFNEDDQVTLLCEPSVSGSFNFTWKNVKTNQVIKSVDAGQSFNFSSINRNDEGEYKVTVRDELSCFSRNATFNILVNCK